MPPLLIPAILGGAKFAGGGIAAYGQYRASKENAAALEWNAQMAQVQAADAMQRAQIDIADIRREQQALVSAQTASYAAQGVDVSKGVSLALAEETDARANEDARRVWRNAAYQAWGYQQESMQYMTRAGQTRRRGRFDAASSLLGGATSGAETFFENAGITALKPS